VIKHKDRVQNHHSMAKRLPEEPLPAAAS